MASENPQNPPPGQQPQPEVSSDAPSDGMAMGGRVLFLDVTAAFEYLDHSHPCSWATPDW